MQFLLAPLRRAASSISGLSLKNTKRASEPACPSGHSFYNTTCGDTGYFEGCFDEEPCDHRVETLGAAVTIYLISVIAATSTQTISSTRTKSITSTTSTSGTSPTTSSFFNTLRSSSHLPTPSSSTNTTASSTPAQTATPVAAVSSAPSKTSLSSSSSRPDIAAVAAGTVGAFVGAIIALILILLILKRRKRRTEEKVQTTKHDDLLRVEGYGSNGTFKSTQDQDGSECAPAYRDADDNSLLYTGTSNVFNDGNAAYRPNDSHSAVPSLSPIQLGSKTAGPTSDPTGRQPELEVPVFHGPVELLPKTERSLINVPRQTPSLSSLMSSSQGGLRQMADGSVMHPNMSLVGEEVGGDDAKKIGGGHVMSWMDYDGHGPVPER